MTRVAILPVPLETGGISYRGAAGEARSQGKTAGEALDALTTQLTDNDAAMLVLVQSLRPDRFFNAVQQQRLTELITRWREANNTGRSLPVDEQAELDNLVDQELRASADRASALADEAGR